MSAIAQSQQLTVVLALWWPDDDADGHSCQRGLYFEISYLSTTIYTFYFQALSSTSARHRTHLVHVYKVMPRLNNHNNNTFQLY